MNLPLIRLNCLEAITDDTGVLQHSKFGIPNRLEGYTTDDNARALIALIKYNKIEGLQNLNLLINTYSSFLFHMQKPDGKMHNFLSYDRKYLDSEGSEDCIGRTLWATGYTINSDFSTDCRLISKEIFNRAFRWACSFTSPRAQAYTILGLSHYHKACPEDRNLSQNMIQLSERLLGYYRNIRSDDWRWFEPYLTYVNGRLPQALFEAYRETGGIEYLQTAEESFQFLLELQIINDRFVPIGNKGWYQRGGQRSFYDQQSIEASSMTEAAISAFKATSNRFYREKAETIFSWFLGNNVHGVPVYDSETGSCYDGLTEIGLNLNKGAEAIISYLSARMDLEI
jgi:hypothetical protein